MCERPPFWRYVIKDLVETISSIPRLIRSPGFESSMGYIFTLGFLFYAFIDHESPGITRIVLALLSVPSFIIYKHGIYRTEGDC